jgi:hypothetical protein
LIADADGNVREIFYDDNGRQTGTRFYHYPTDQRPPTEASGIVHPASAYPPKRTRLETKNVLDASGSVLTSFTTVMPQTFDVALKVYKDDLAAPEIRNEGSLTQYDALGRAYRTIDENGRVTETTFDRRGLAIQTRSEAVDQDGNPVFMLTRTVYNSQGRSVYATGSFSEDVFANSPASITGTHREGKWDGGNSSIATTQFATASFLRGRPTGRIVNQSPCFSATSSVHCSSP